MFGYVTICEPEIRMKDWRRYRAYYCGLCQSLKERYGSLGQLTLTYDMTFLIILLNSLYEKEMKRSAHRCKTHPIQKRDMLQNEFTDYAADMNLILAYYHLKDDWQDEKKISSLAVGSAIRRKAEKAIKKYPRQSTVIRRELKALSKLEAENEQNIDLPAGCFGRLMEEILVYEKDIWEDTLRRIGFFLGKFIYIMDACDDLENDLKTGSYNPLKEYSKREDYNDKCHEMLCMMIAESTAAFEKLPCLEDVEILRNILYAGVWTKYNQMREKKNKAEKEETNDSI
ncbi:MAG: DUF5685 family protein [Schaedlerella sp.]|nr:DUF5685 family protein [Schaedlerella sp.]